MEAHAHQVPEPRPQETPRVTDAVTKLLTRDEQGELEVVRQLRKLLDEAVTVPGTKFKVGLDPIIGLLPGVGDVSAAAIGAYILRAAHRLGVPTVVMIRMLGNLLVDAVLGLVPIIGDYLDALYKANAKNAALVEQAVVNRKTTARASWLRLAMVFGVFFLIVLGGFIGTVLLAKLVWNAVG